MATKKTAAQHSDDYGPAELDRRFGFVELTDDQRQQCQQVRAGIRDLAGALDHALPSGREKAVVLTHLEEAGHWAIAAICRQVSE